MGKSRKKMDATKGRIFSLLVVLILFFLTIIILKQERRVGFAISEEISEMTPVYANGSENTSLGAADSVEQPIAAGKMGVGVPVLWTKKVSVVNDGQESLRETVHFTTFRNISNLTLMKGDEVISPEMEVALGQDEATYSFLQELPPGEEEYTVLFITPPATQEEISEGDYKKRIIISADTPYQNVLVETAITPSERESIHLYWIKDQQREVFPIDTFTDADGDGLIEKIAWTVPHLSDQEFEVEIIVLNVQSYPSVGGSWSVLFNTTGQADLLISAVDGTRWSNTDNSHDLKFLEVVCGDVQQDYEWMNDSVFIANYSCDDVGTETSIALTPGAHHLMFDFGGQVAYANNFAGCGSAWCMDVNLAGTGDNHSNASFWGEASNDWSGMSVSGVGDVNGDGFDDFMIGAYNRNPSTGAAAGESYLVLGKVSGWVMDVNLSGAGDNRSNASFWGETTSDYAGFSVSGVGDVNGDGFDDFMIGAAMRNPGSESQAGESYLVLGKVSGWSMDTNLNGAGDNRSNASFWGETTSDYAGFSVSGVGDVNGDGYDDFMIGAYGRDPSTGAAAGESYLIFGRSSGWNMDTNLNGAGDNRSNASFWGETTSDRAGYSVSGVGDVNGDGYDDFMIGAASRNPGSVNAAGESYLILGKAFGWSMDTNLNGAVGNRSNASFWGEGFNDWAGSSVSGVGDVNGDTLDDFMIGAPYHNPGSAATAGESYLIFGRNSSFTPKVVSSIKLYTDSACTQEVSEGTAYLSAVNQKMYVEVQAAGGSAGVAEVADVLLNSSNDVRPIKVKAIETGVDTNVFRGSFRVRTGASNRETKTVRALNNTLLYAYSWDDQAKSTSTTVIYGVPSGASGLCTAPWCMDVNLSGVGGNRSNASFWGEATTDQAGGSVSGVGDVNGDGFDDFMIGASSRKIGSAGAAGESYLVLGRSGGWVMDVNLSGVGDNRSNASFWGEARSDFAGWSVSGVGDVNGDGFDDFMISAEGRNPGTGNIAGESYLVLGRSGGWVMDVNLSGVDDNRSNASFWGESANGYSGVSVSGVGDVNGDGFDDFMIGAYNRDPGTGASAGESYLIFGRASGWNMDTNLNGLGDNRSNASFWGEAAFDNSGYSVSGVGDVNGDGFDDFMIGAYGRNPGTGFSAGESYLIFGRASGWNMDTNLNGAGDNRSNASFWGEAGSDFAGWSVSGVGDVNGDGFDDLMIGAHQRNPDSASQAGESYLILGRASGWNMDTNLNGANDNRSNASFWGEAMDDMSGSVSGVGDVNGDGFDDLMIGAYQRNPGSASQAGESYLILGRTSGWVMDVNLSGVGDNRSNASFWGEAMNDNSGWSVSGVGDVNGDGFDDVMIGAFGRKIGSANTAGESYLIMGRNSSFTPKVVSSIKLYTDSAYTQEVSGGIAYLSAVNQKMYVEVQAAGGSASVAEVAVVLFNSSNDVRPIKVKAIETGVNTDVYRGSFRVRTGASNRETKTVRAVNNTLLYAYSWDDQMKSTSTNVIYGVPYVAPELCTASWCMDTNLSGVGDNRSNASFWGEATNDGSGFSVSGVGDVNGDGFDDFVIGAYGRDPGSAVGAGESYLVLGRGSGWVLDVNLSGVGDNSSNASFWGESSSDYSGVSVSGVGDVNGDGFDDFVIGAYGRNTGSGIDAGESYLVLGRGSGWVLDVNLSGVDDNRSNASFWGEATSDLAGIYVSGVGDVNGDGFDDFVIGADGRNIGSGIDVGESYLVLGRQSGWSMDTQLGNCGVGSSNCSNASFWGEREYDRASVVSGVGDVNGDGYDDFLIGAYTRSPSSGLGIAGESYLILGRPAGWVMDVNLSGLGDNRSNASFWGEANNDNSASSLSGVGDVNGDGYDDFLIGAPDRNTGGAMNGAGESYLILGRSSGWNMDTNLNGAGDNRSNASFLGDDWGDRAGIVSGVGDVNGDGYDDFVIGAYRRNPGSADQAGESYLVFGRASGWVMDTSLSGLGDNRSNASFWGESSSDYSGVAVSGVGDVNGDLFDDVLIGAYKRNPGTASSAGESYLIMGRNSSFMPKTVSSIKLYTDSAYTQEVSGGIAYLSAVNQKMYVEVQAAGGSTSVAEVADVLLNSSNDVRPIKVKAIETGINTNIYRGSFRVRTGASNRETKTVRALNNTLLYAYSWDDQSKSISTTVIYGVPDPADNNPPTIDGVNLTPVTAYTNDVLNCTFSINDADTGDTIIYWYVWFNGSAAYSTGTGTYTAINNWQSLVPTITSKGDVWICQVNATDGQSHWTAPMNSSSVTIQNSVPMIVAVDPFAALDPIEGSARNIWVNFTAEDADGYTSINIASAVAVLERSGLRRASGLCAGTLVNATAVEIGCNVSLQYYDPPGVWTIGVSVNDTSDAACENDSTVLTYNTLSAIRLNTSLLDFGAVDMGSSMTTSLLISNTGNLDYHYLLVNGSDLINGLSRIGAGNFSVNVSPLAGFTVINDAEVNITGAVLDVSNDTVSANQTLFLKVTVPIGLPALPFYSSREWLLVAER